jgi:hypothetical protein
MSNLAELPAPSVSACIQSALRQLLQAHDYACELNQDVWQFAVEIESLRFAGLTNADLRWLVCKGYVEHGRERTQPGDPHRLFRAAPNLALGRRSCFVLTPTGLQLTQQEHDEPEAAPPWANGNGDLSAAAPAQQAAPHWDEAEHTLYWHGRLVKRYRYEAPNQELVLSAFQSRGWVSRVEVALPEDGGGSYKERLHDTIKSLNRSVRPLLHFRQFGSHVSWEPGKRVP